MDLHPLFLPKHRRPPRKKGQLYEQVVQVCFARNTVVAAPDTGYLTGVAVATGHAAVNPVKGIAPGLETQYAWITV